MSVNRGVNKEIYFVVFGIFLMFSTLSCDKLVQVPNPISSVTTNQVYSSDATATAAMLGIYSYMSSTQAWSNSFTSAFLGESADELRDELSGYERYDLF